MTEFRIHIVEAGTKIYFNDKGEYNLAKDSGCIWGSDNCLYFTELAWNKYCDRKSKDEH